MPIRIPATLPAADVLSAEGVMVMREDEADRQDIRPMRIALLNLMPKKIVTETQFARLIGASPLQVELTLVRPSDHMPKTESQAHIGAHYVPWREIRDQKFDGLIITGAPIEHLPYEEVT
ncbi:MAG: homoserine O-succinyltransferase, partial [Maritimibacter sp.]|nr:homoserine O-succinyltransferase [Maritimibacter sp.]